MRSLHAGWPAPCRRRCAVRCAPCPVRPASFAASATRRFDSRCCSAPASPARHSHPSRPSRNPAMRSALRPGSPRAVVQVLARPRWAGFAAQQSGPTRKCQSRTLTTPKATMPWPGFAPEPACPAAAMRHRRRSTSARCRPAPAPTRRCAVAPARSSAQRPDAPRSQAARPAPLRASLPRLGRRHRFVLQPSRMSQRWQDSSP